MSQTTQPQTIQPETIEPSCLDGVDEAMRTACRRVAPLWPLENFVAVNPYLGLAGEPFSTAARSLARTAGARSAMDRDFYLDAFERGIITDDDIAVALSAVGTLDDTDPRQLLAATRLSPDDGPVLTVPTVAEVASEVTGHDWSRLVTDRVGSWAAAYFDLGQALWRSADASAGPFASWRHEATIDRTPEIMGLKGFRSVIRSMPDDAVLASARALRELDVPETELQAYLHRLLVSVIGWASHARRLAWEEERRGGRDDVPEQVLAVLLCWEAALHRTLGPRGVSERWGDLMAGSCGVPGRTGQLHGERLLVLQEAFDRSAQRRFVERFTGGVPPAEALEDARPLAHAVFCIDVRSEVLRRHLEATDAGIETLGFAGFFGFPIGYLPIGHDAAESQCPVLLSPSHIVPETVGDPDSDRRAVESRQRRHQVRRAWKAFKMGAISCFTFVGPVGLTYVPKLLRDTFGRSRPTPRHETEGLPKDVVGDTGPGLDVLTPDGAVGMPLADRVELAERTLRAMSLTGGFAPVVLLVGHGSTTVNNPYGTGLDCGACGGHSGAVNARVAACVFNDPDVRRQLRSRGISIPSDTWFVGAFHDTTTDDVVVHDSSTVAPGARPALEAIQQRLRVASEAARLERAGRLGIDPSANVAAEVRRRSTDWAQVRPEWALAGCHSFVAAPRHRTAGMDLGGRTFLHSYDWRQDHGYDVLELIMTAPLVVASWINLQYFASTVDHPLFGSGDKTLHNVVGRLGVVEGSGGDLRVGLPWQSVNDGARWQHEPLRLTVVIEAPTEAMTAVLEAHPDVRDLADNGWLSLFALDDGGRVAHRYAGALTWDPVASGPAG